MVYEMLVVPVIYSKYLRHASRYELEKRPHLSYNSPFETVFEWYAKYRNCEVSGKM